MSIKVRFAPSPTGYLHVGGLRTALYNYLYAKKNDGKIILRIEDTDQSRKVEGAVENLISTFKNIGIEFDEGPSQGGDFGPYFQSQRLDIYKDYIQKLILNKSAYPCFCSSDRLTKIREKQSENKEPIKYDRHCLSLADSEINSRMNNEKYVIRLKIPNEGEVIFYDQVRGKVSIECKEIDDQVLIKTDGFPTYHFANVVDDYLMGITHVMRGEEWLPSTPKHVLLYQAFDWKLPKFIHLPLLLNPDKSKLSKRQGDVAVEDYLSKGYLSETLINFVGLLGWHPKDDREIFNLDELINEFSIKRVQKSGAVFDKEKLNWMNGQYLKEMKISTILNRVVPIFEDAGIDISDTRKFSAVVENARQRVSTLPEMIEHSIPFYSEINFIEEDKLILTSESSQKVFKVLSDKLLNSNDLQEINIKQYIKEAGIETNVKGKDLFLPIRLVLFGEKHGPDIALIISILGKKESIKRLTNFH
ncbi:MAG: glutamate--tRNA ligase [Candidatus Marinimicrobia bacterium]|nr:glutamate--tRNA ligase [Candidatus Neomarinimicrobiota bacterium]